MLNMKSIGLADKRDARTFKTFLIFGAVTGPKAFSIITSLLRFWNPRDLAKSNQLMKVHLWRAYGPI